MPWWGHGTLGEGLATPQVMSTLERSPCLVKMVEEAYEASYLMKKPWRGPWTHNWRFKDLCTLDEDEVVIWSLGTLEMVLGHKEDIAPTYMMTPWTFGCLWMMGSLVMYAMVMGSSLKPLRLDATLGNTWWHTTNPKTYGGMIAHLLHPWCWWCDGYCWHLGSLLIHMGSLMVPLKECWRWFGS